MPDPLYADPLDSLCEAPAPVAAPAGAGNGKTTILTTRLAHLLFTGRAQPRRVLAVTFTNKTARVIRWHLATVLLFDMRYAITATGLFFLLSGCSLFGVWSGYEQPAYAVVERQGDAIEVRRYPPRVAAEATVAGTDGKTQRNEAFKILFDYISGANRAEARIDMTAPVDTTPTSAKIAMTVPVETTRSDEEGMRMRFFLPLAYSVESAPRPTDPRIRIVEVPEQTLAVLRFSGSRSDETVSDRTAELTRALETTPWRAASAPTAYFYDPPWTLPFLRRNEVAVAVER